MTKASADRSQDTCGEAASVVRSESKPRGTSVLQKPAFATHLPGSVRGQNTAFEHKALAKGNVFYRAVPDKQMSTVKMLTCGLQRFGPKLTARSSSRYGYLRALAGTFRPVAATELLR